MATTPPHNLPLALRRLFADQLRDLVGRLRAADPTVDAAADALIDDMLPPCLTCKKADAGAFGPVAGDRRFNAADLRELALGLCVLDPGAGAAALEEITGHRKGRKTEKVAVGVGSGPLGLQVPGTPTPTSRFTTDSGSSGGSASSSAPSSSSSSVAGIESGDKPKNNKKKTKSTIKKWFIYFLEPQEYVNEGIAFRGY
ncbi:hypothetical protein DL768_009260 [Monosporascus sp. mg162]|nr:hypothetical protein DL768_009260 [Monosporascus sp. mg162]